MVSLAAFDWCFVTYFTAPEWPFLSIRQAAYQDRSEQKVACTLTSLQLCLHNEIALAPHPGYHY